MRIALLARRFDPSGGGTERDLIVTAKCLIDAGYDVTIYASELRSGAAGFKLKQVGGPALGRTLGLVTFAYAAPAAARRDGADLVLSFARTVHADVLRSGGSAHISYVRAARKWRTEVAARAMWATPYHRAQMFIERRGFRSPHLRAAIGVSNLVGADLMHEFHLGPDKVFTLYNGVDLERFTPPRDDSARRAMCSRLGVADDAPIVAFVGNGFGRKGLRFLIEAWPKVALGRLVVVGSDRAASWYRRESVRLGMGERVRFLGPQPDVARIFHGVDALALPSLFEPFGNVVMEAMACSLPVMTSAQSGASELVPDAMKPFIVADPANPEEIAQKMNELLSVTRELRDVARATAEKYTWQRYADELLKIISHVA